MDKDVIFSLYEKTQTVFSLKEIAMLYPSITYNNLKRRLSYYVSTGKLRKLRKNVYSKINYDPFEIPQKIYFPSYISLDTALQEKGIIKKKLKTIFSISHISRKIIVDKNTIVYRLMPERILFNKQGIDERSGYFIASPERAFTDAVYIYKDYHFDNLKNLDWDKVIKIKNIYENKSFEKRIKNYYDQSI